MRTAVALALAASLITAGNAAIADPADAWRPMYSFIGTWKGTRAGNEESVKVTRAYTSAPTNHHIEITESGGGKSRAVWGVVSFDAQRQALVLRHFAADGSASELPLDPAASTTDQLVFVSPESEGARTRITYERSNWRNLVERIENAADGAPFTVVSETRFERKD